MSKGRIALLFLSVAAFCVLSVGQTANRNTSNRNPTPTERCYKTYNRDVEIINQKHQNALENAHSGEDIRRAETQYTADMDYVKAQLKTCLDLNPTTHVGNTKPIRLNGVQRYKKVNGKWVPVN